MPIINLVYEAPREWKPGANTIAYRKLEENANDSVGGYNGTNISGITYDTLASGKKVAKTTTNTGNIAVPGTLAGAIGSNDFTISFWVYITGVKAAGEQYSIMFWVGGNSSPRPGPEVALNNGRFAGGGIYFSPQYSGGITSTTTYNQLLNKWTYITYTRIGTTLKGYINAVEECSQTATTSFSSGNVGWIFTRGDSNQSLYTGSMGSEFIVEKQGWSTDYITKYYNSTKSLYGIS